jgi:hypothetical protein
VCVVVWEKEEVCTRFALSRDKVAITAEHNSSVIVHALLHMHNLGVGLAGGAGRVYPLQLYRLVHALVHVL